MKELKVGTIGKFEHKVFLSYNVETKKENSKTFLRTGVILNVPETNNGRYEILTCEGEMYNIDSKNLHYSSSARLKPQIREYFTEIAKMHEKLNKDIVAYRKMEIGIQQQRGKIGDKIQEMKKNNADFIGVYTLDETIKMLQSIGLDVIGYSNEVSKDVFITAVQSKNVERYNVMDKNLYPFVVVEYDCNAYCYRDAAPKEYDKYATKNAPATNEKIAKFAKRVTKDISAGEKYLSAETTYHFFFKNGLEKSLINAIVEAGKQ